MTTLLFDIDDVLSEYETVLAEEPDTPAKRWCLENPPTYVDATVAVLSVLASLNQAA